MLAKKHTVLVVDDEPDVVKSVQDLLRLEHRVLGATRAQDAMAVMASNEVHVVMTDQRMPDMTGVQFLSHVRSTHPDAVRLLFTGYADIRAVIDAINEGNVWRYITKPWDAEELQTIIRQACEQCDLRAERQRLMHQLKATNAELERACSELKEADALKRAFIQVASHELRTPLTILLGLSSLAVRALEAEGSGLRAQGSGSTTGNPQLATFPEDLADWVHRIDQAGLRLQRIVDQLIKMLSAGQFARPLQRRLVDMPSLLQQAADDVAPFVALRKQTLVLDWPADLGTLSVEPEKIRDSINHLLLNAVKFTPDEGRVTLAGLRRPDGAIEIRVSDTGIGMDAATQQRLFEPFFTGYDVSRHSSGQYEHGRRGIGLGLTLVKAFVQMHGGQVHVRSEVGMGSTFTITLPAEPPSRAAAQPAA